MSGIHVYRSRSFLPLVTVAVAVALCCLAPAAQAQQAGAEAQPWQREFDELTQRLQVQQEQLERQAAQLGQLQHELDANRQSPPAARDAVPPAGTPAIAVSRIYQADQPAPADPYPVPTYYQASDTPWIDIGGQYRLMFNSANFGFHPATITDAQQPSTFFNQRFRTWLTVRPSDHVEGHIELEIGHVGWGTNFDFPKTYPWPVGDRTGIELRKGYLTYHNDGVGQLRGGIQGWQDPFGQTLASSDWDFSVGGLSWQRVFPSLGEMSMLLGMFVLDEQVFDQAGAQQAWDAQLYTLDLDWGGPDSSSFGLSAYFLPDSGEYSYPTAVPYDSAWDAWIGVRGKTTLLGWLPVGAFAIYNVGERNDIGVAPTFRHEGAALKFEAGPVPWLAGNLSLQTLYSTGDSDPNVNRSKEFRTIAQSARDNFGSQGYWSYLVLTSPHGPSDVNDLGVGLQNRGLGLLTVQMKYDYPIIGSMSGVLAGGWLRSDVANPTSLGREIGTELTNIFIIDFGGGLKTEFGAAVLFTGDFYSTAPGAPHPDNLWEVFTRVQLEF